MDTTSYVVLVSLSTIKAHVNGINPIHYYCVLILRYQFYYLLHIRSQQTVLRNMLCYTSLCTSSTLGTSAIFSLASVQCFLKIPQPWPQSPHITANDWWTDFIPGWRPGISTFKQSFTTSLSSPLTSLHTRTRYVSSAGNLEHPHGLCMILPSATWLLPTHHCLGKK